jgi:ABC-type Fe3+ transport system, permease component
MQSASAFRLRLPVLLLLRLLLRAEQDMLSTQAWLWIGNSVWVGVMVAAVTVGLALLLQLRQRLWQETWATWISRLLGLGYAIPGAVLALGILIPLAYLDNRLVDMLKSLGLHPSGLILTGSTLALIYAITIRFFGVAANSTQAAFARIANSLDDGARVLGMSPGEIFRRVHWPLVRRSAYAAALLVFIDTLKELPATIALRPFNFDTLATVTYNFARDERLSEAALPSLLIVLASLPAVLLLTRQRESD